MARARTSVTFCHGTVLLLGRADMVVGNGRKGGRRRKVLLGISGMMHMAGTPAAASITSLQAAGDHRHDRSTRPVLDAAEQAANLGGDSGGRYGAHRLKDSAYWVVAVAAFLGLKGGVPAAAPLLRHATAPLLLPPPPACLACCHRMRRDWCPGWNGAW